MSNSTRYFQLTPDILVEYNYNNVSTINNQTGYANHMIDLGNDAYVIDNSFCSNKTFFLDRGEYTNSDSDNKEEYGYKNVSSNFVLPLNASESKFIQCKKDNVFVWNRLSEFGKNEVYSTASDSDNDILCDTFRLHFTSRNYLGNNKYDGFIISVYTYDKLKNKVGLLSHYIRKTDDPNLNDTPELINQKLYTTYFDFIIPNINGLPESLKSELFKKYDIMDNAPIVMSIYGVKSTVYLTTLSNFECYNTEKINTIFIPVIDNSNNLSVYVDESKDGDYFEIYTKVGDGEVSLSDYIYNLSDGSPERYLIFYELILKENVVDTLNNPHSIITHREQFIINAVNYFNSDEMEINESEIDRVINYRPVLRYSGDIQSFTIEIKAHIINTLDNTTIIVKGSCDCENPKKYGKRMNRIYLGSVPAQVNVYNKRTDVDTDGIKLTNASSNVKIENHQHSVIGFIECMNVGVSIEQIPADQLQ